MKTSPPPSIKEPFAVGLYRRDITAPEQMLATTIGRDHQVNDLLEKLKRRCNKNSGQNHLFIGPRGIGKTHLLTLLSHHIVNDETLNNGYTIIRFPEESNRVISFADLLLGIVELLTEADNKQDWQTLYEQLKTEENDEFIIDTILPRLKLWHKQNDKILLVLMENLDVLLTQQIKSKQDIHRIRRLLMDNSHVVLVGTAPTFFPALNDVKHPLYDFFDIQIIEELNQEQTLTLIESRLKWEAQDEILQQFEALKPRVLAMHTLTGGNPRLIMMLYELIVQDNLVDIKTRFHQMLDRITPFYQDRIKDLPPQERALLETIALMRIQKRTPVNIAKQFRKPRHQTSVLLKRMTKAGYLSVSPNPEDKRSRLYRIKEGFFDIWLAMNESRVQRKRMPYIVDFFSLWYASVQERETKRRQLLQQLSERPDNAIQKILEGLDYLSEATTDAKERTFAKLELAAQQLKLNYADNAQITLSEIKTLANATRDGFLTLIHESASNWEDNKQRIDVIQRMEKIVLYWREQRSGELERAAILLHDLSLDFSGHGLHQLNVALLKERLESNSTAVEEINLWLGIAASEKISGQLNAALTSLKRALEISVSSGNCKLEGTTLNNISQIYDARGDYERALSYLTQALAIRQEIGDVAGLCATLFNMAHIHWENKEQQQALSTWLTVYKLAKQMNLAQALEALDGLGKQLGMEGLSGWEVLGDTDKLIT